MSELQEGVVQRLIFDFGLYKMAPELQHFLEYIQDFFVRKYEQTEEITKKEKFLESLKECV